MQDQDRPVATSTLATAIGGTRGVVDSALPPLLFVLVYAWLGLRAAVAAALVLAGVLLAVRLTRREPLRYAANGLFGVVISALVALWLGRAEGFFLPGIIVNAVYAAAFLVSIVVRKPLVGLVLAALDPRAHAGPVTGRVARVHVWATAGWAAVFGVRVAVQGALYLANQPGWLAATKIALGWPLTLLAVALTTAAVRRARPDAGASGVAVAENPPANGDPTHRPQVQGSVAQGPVAHGPVAEGPGLDVPTMQVSADRP